MQRAHRGKQLDWSRPFKLIDSKAVFDELDTDNNQLVININSKAQASSHSVNKKEEIIVPKIQTVRRITEPKKFAKVEPNYIRLTQDLNLPKLQSYELNEVDHVFLQGHANKFKLNGKTILTPQFLSKAFIELQKKAGKEPTLPRSKQWMTNFVEKNYKQYTTMPNYDNFTQTFYNYWKNRRQQLKFPMLRQLWHPNPEQYNHLMAFKPREKDKRNLRRARIAEDQISQQMQEDFLLATKIAERIKFRQQLKLKLVQSQLTSFHNQCKQLFGIPAFFGSIDSQSRSRDKQKLKRLQADVENVKKLQIQQEKQNQIQNIAIATYDQKQSIAQFLASVIGVAENFGFSHEKIFTDKVSVPKVVVSSSLPEKEPDIQQQKQKSDFMSMKLYRHGNTIYRTISQIQDQTQQSYMKYPKDIFQYKARQLQLYFYGTDDDGESKDLRKNIASSFKRFQQSKQSSMTEI